MDIQHLHGGKTAPRLLQDLNVYDGRSDTGFNILSQIPFHDEEQETLPLPVNKDNCKHQWSMKRNQCNLPKDGFQPDLTTLWAVAAYCVACRSHLELSLDFREFKNTDFTPCPTRDRPLHHFVHQPDQSQPQQISYPVPVDGFAWVDTQVFQCSSRNCHAKLTIKFKPPRIIPFWVKQLTDQETIKYRAEKVIASDSARFEGHSVPQPIEVLNNMKGYLHNAMYVPEKAGKKIVKGNKKWMLNLGDSCADMLVYIGFSREEDDGWMPPMSEVNAKAPFNSPINVRLDDILNELQVLISERPNDEKRAIKFQYKPEGAVRDLSSVLGCLEYKQSKRSRTVDLTKEEHPFYAGLGAIEDFHDELVIFAYEWQKRVDRKNVDYYLECLQGIADGRNSEDLQTEVAIEASNDMISLRDVRTAYKDLGLDQSAAYEDETIIGNFQSRITDAPKQEAELRRALKIIGQERTSHNIQAIASQSVTNYEQALNFFSVRYNTMDGLIIDLHRIKVRESPFIEPTSRLALSLIAEHRNSDYLRSFLETGIIHEVEMGYKEAYALLDIHEPKAIDDDTLLAVYQTRFEDTTDSERLRRLPLGLAAIAKVRDSSTLKNFLGGIVETPDHTIAEWPVGLQNIGNTCYLNSMLQSYFTIKPLRELVLGIEDFLTTVNEENIGSKRVGGRLITKDEVNRSQQFGLQLRTLFKDMIESPKVTVKPEAKLVHLALIKAKKTEELQKTIFGFVRERTMLEAGQTDQEDTEMFDAPLTDPHAREIISDISNTDTDTGAGSDSDSPSNGSPATIRGDDSDVGPEGRHWKERQFRGPDNKDQHIPSPGGSGHPISFEVNEQSNIPEFAKATQGSLTETIVDTGVAPVQDNLSIEAPSTTAPHPDRPPPVPPRPPPAEADLQKHAEQQRQAERSAPRPKTEEENLLEQAEVSASRQEDVQELIDNVLFQLQCAIKADDNEKDTGEQIDRIKHLFYGKQKVYITDSHGVRPQESYMFNIIVDASKGSIYGALDHSLWCERDIYVDGEDGSEHTTVTQLPPILQIFVERTGFKEGTGAFKMYDHLQLQDTIYMDRYMDSSTKTDLDKRHRKMWRYKKGLEELMKAKETIIKDDPNGRNKGFLFHGALDELRDLELHIKNQPLGIPDVYREKLQVEADRFDKKMEKCDFRIERLRARLASEFDDLKDMEYRLQSVFVHQGGSNAGHYWVYIYDFVAKIWRKYNDGTVTEATRDDVFEPHTSGPNATPYFLVYVKADEIDELIDCVRRDPIKDEPQEDPDTKMEDIGDVTESSNSDARQGSPEDDAAESHQAYDENDATQPSSDDGISAWS